LGRGPPSTINKKKKYFKMQFYGVSGLFIVYMWWYFGKLMANDSLFRGIDFSRGIDFFALE
jgi:hypothetical protein